MTSLMPEQTTLDMLEYVTRPIAKPILNFLYALYIFGRKAKKAAVTYWPIVAVVVAASAIIFFGADGAASEYGTSIWFQLNK